MPKLSIIVPVYKAETVLPKCVDSVFAQTYPDWELLLVDDGSGDGSGKLCDAYAAKDPRVKAIHKDNGGVSSARNLGMERAVGDYILFLDSDDWADPAFCEKLLAAAEAAGADSSGCAHWAVEVSGEKRLEPGAMPRGVYGKEEMRRGIVDRLLGHRLGQPGEVLNGFIWRFLFSRKIIRDHDIRFAGAYLEDELFLMEYFCLAEKLAMLDEPLYDYLQNPASVTRNYLPNYMDTFRKFMEAKQALAHKYGLGGGDPDWVHSSNWAGLLIAIGNEYAPGNPASGKEKKHRVAAYAMEKEMAEAIRALRPRGMSRNKQIVADLVRRRWFGVLTMMYNVKNRGK
ncbi:MAG: glycosyltransferase [Clostridia bacterium]|nr:glycosyltransferase [Clostridia bacterium]